MANTFKFGNKQWYGKKGSVLAYNDENNNFKPLPFTFTRSSSATRVNKDGLIEVVGSDEPRVDYLNNADGHLLLEPQRENKINYSEDISSWSAVNAPTITTNIAIAPDGNNTADGIQDTTSGSFKRVQQSISVSANSTVTGSVFIKKETSETNYGGMQFDFTGGTRKLSYVAFDAVNGLAVNLTGSSITPSSIKVIDFSSDWWRLEVTTTDTGSNTSLSFAYYATISSDFVNTSLGVGSVRTIWGLQVEIAGYATSYIPTSGSSVTRAAEASSQDVPTSVINSTEGVLYIDISALVDDSVQKFISLSDGTTTNRLIIGYDNSSNRIISFARVGGVLSFDMKVVVSNIKDYNKLAIKWKENDFALWGNGVELATDTSGTSFSSGVLNNLKFSDADGTTEIFYGKTKDFRIYNTALTDSELIALTS